ncbi:MAG: hypothetical protein ACQETB_06900 [Halobacteriota archaeon]
MGRDDRTTGASDDARTHSRRALLRTLGGGAAIGAASSLSGCLDGDRCAVVYEGTDSVDAGGERSQLLTLSTETRIYVRSEHRRGARPSVRIDGPDDEPVFETAREQYVEAVYEATADGPHRVRLRNESAVETGVWATTIVVYDGWCPEVF